MKDDTKTLQAAFVFGDIDTMSLVCGSNNEHIETMELLLGNSIYSVANQLKYITNSYSNLEDFKNLCGLLHDACARKMDITTELINTMYMQLTGNKIDISVKNTKSIIDKSNNTSTKNKCNEITCSDDIAMISIPITGKKVMPKTECQKQMIQSLEKNLISFLVGPAGTGKTYFTTAFSLSQLLLKKKKQYIIARPVVEAGERLGFLPGDFEQKISPYLRPIYDVLYELVGEDMVNVLQEKRQLEIVPLAYMRGRSLKNAVVVLDEAQNCTPVQMKMFLTRLGEGSIGIVNGDLTQSDLNVFNGLEEAVDIFANINRVGIVRLSDEDIQRSKLAKIVIESYNKRNYKTTR